jgi:hypothetical protein
MFVNAAVAESCLSEYMMLRSIKEMIARIGVCSL